MRPFITVVSGIPRSGTSLAMQMLVAGGVPALTDGQRTADDDNPRGYYEFERVKALRNDAGWLDEAVGKVVKIIHMLLMELPAGRTYRVVFVERDLAEVVKSQAAMLARSGKPGGGLPPERLVAVYEGQLRAVRAWLGSRPDVATLVVPHRELIRSPAAQAEAMNAFLGGDLDVAAMTAAVDPSLHRNRSS